MHNKNYLTPIEVADLFMVSPITVRQWAQKGLLDAVTTAGGHRRFLVDEIERFAKSKGITLPGMSKSKHKILIVDDDPLVSGFLFELLVEQNNVERVDVAIDGFDAGIKVQSFKPDIIVLDLMMPGMDGFEVCKKIRQIPELRHIKIVAVTGYYSEGNVKKILEAGADTCLPKPIEMSDLLAALGLTSEQTEAAPNQTDIGA